jgi:hypothetical protein
MLENFNILIIVIILIITHVKWHWEVQIDDDGDNFINVLVLSFFLIFFSVENQKKQRQSWKRGNKTLVFPLCTSRFHNQRRLVSLRIENVIVSVSTFSIRNQKSECVYEWGEWVNEGKKLHKLCKHQVAMIR